MLSVPAAPRFRMTNPPLVQAVVQVNFPIVARLETVEGIAPLQDALSDVFPYMAQQVVQEVALMIGPAGPAAPQSANRSIVYQFTDDEGWTLAVTVSSATLSAGPAYAGVEDFADRFRRICEALHSTSGVRRCDRLGVRYVNFVELSDGEPDWATWFGPRFVGLSDPALSEDSLVASLTETRLQRAVPATPEGPVEGVIRHGVVPAGSVMQGVPPRPIDQRTFVLDMDTYVQSSQPFEPEQLAEQCLALHDEIEKVFYWAVTDAGRKHFGYEPL